MWTLAVLVLLSGYCLGELSGSQLGSPYTFWKTTKRELLPRTEHLLTKVRHALLTYFRTELVELSETSGDSLQTAEKLYKELNISLIPSERVLNTETDTSSLRFVKRVLKQNYGRHHSFVRILTKEKTFRCRIKDSLSKHICASMTSIETQMKALADTSKHLLAEVLQMKKVNARAILKIERQLSLKLLNAKKADITRIGSIPARHHNRHKHRSYDSGDDVSYIDVADLQKPYAKLYTERNKASVVVLYALLKHLYETVAELEYAVKVL